MPKWVSLGSLTASGSFHLIFSSTVSSSEVFVLAFVGTENIPETCSSSPKATVSA